MKTIKIYLLLAFFLINANIQAQEKKDLCLNLTESSQTLGGVANEGNLQVVIYDNSNMQVFKYDLGSWIHQWYGTSSKSIWLYAGGVSYRAMGSYYSGTSTVLTTISNTKINANTAILTLQKTGKLRVKQTTYYPPNSANIYYTWEITNISDSVINNFRFFSGGDTYLGGNDFGAGFWLPNEKAVGVKKITNNTMLKLEMQGITAPYAYESRYYISVYQSIVSNALLNIIDSTETTDNALALEYRRNSLSPGETWTIQAVEKFNSVPISDVVVLAPVSSQIQSGSSVILDFAVKNRTNNSTTVSLNPSIDLAGWSVSLLSPSTPLTLAANSTQIVKLLVTCPQSAAVESTAKVTLIATNSYGTASDFCDVIVAEPPSIVNQPTNQHLCLGFPAAFSLTANNANTYQWQEFTTEWSNLTDNNVYSGTNTPILNIVNTNDSLNNRKYRCNVINSFGNVISDSALLSVVLGATIIQQPFPSSVCEGEHAVFYLNASNVTDYQWQVNEGNGFINLINDSIYNGVNTNTLHINNTSNEMNGNEYRCKINGMCVELFSDEALLSIFPKPQVELGNDTILNENESITLDAGPGSNYIWSNNQLIGRVVTINASLLGIGTHNISVTVTNENNCVSSDSIAITFTIHTANKEINNSINVNIEPNPTSGKVAIIFPNITKEATIEIYNMQGKLMKIEKMFNSSYAFIDLSKMAEGAYTIRIMSQNQVINKKLIVNKP